MVLKKKHTYEYMHIYIYVKMKKIILGSRKTMKGVHLFKNYLKTLSRFLLMN